jgi:glycosyltransferase involved in cell wall biosynthesis
MMPHRKAFPDDVHGCEAKHVPQNADRYGILFERDADDLARKIQDVESHPEMAAEYRRRAPERILEAYTWEKITEQYEELFLQLAAGEDPTRVHTSVRLITSEEPESTAAAA